MIAPYTRRDTDALINIGIFAERLGHRDEAIDGWNRALTVDPDIKRTHPYLADALYADGKQQEAVPHYEQYLALLASTPEARLDPQDVVRIALRMVEQSLEVKF